eukprot:203141-Pelagomonas_calceolata.AAC.1
MHKFVRVHKASTTTDEKAAMMHIFKFDRIPELYQSLLTARLKNPEVVGLLIYRRDSREA